MSELYIANKNEVPSGGFRFFQAETNFTITAPSWMDLLVNVKKHRTANNIPIGLNFDRDVEQQLATSLPSSQVTADNPNRSAEVARSEWPAWASNVASLKTPEDTGVGDTVARTVGYVGGDTFKTWYRNVFGKDCGCSLRQESLNALYPYH